MSDKGLIIQLDEVPALVFYPPLNMEYHSHRKKIKGLQTHGWIHRNKEIKQKQHIKSVGKLPLKDSTPNQDWTPL